MSNSDYFLAILETTMSSASVCNDALGRFRHRHRWKKIYLAGYLKLPFIDEDRLLSATKKTENELSAEEAKRNMENLDQLFVHSSDNFASRIISSFNDVGLIKQDAVI